MSANTGRGVALSAATRHGAIIIGASSTESEPTSRIDEMMYLHRPTTEKGPGDAANAPDPAPDGTEGWT